MDNENPEDQTFDALSERHQHFLKKYGWLAHFVSDDDGFPNNTNYHTHGLQENFNHLDLQICLPIDPALAQSIFHTVVDSIKEGIVFEPYKAYDNILSGGYAVRFVEATEKERKILRLLIPDQNGRYEAPGYKEQLIVTPEIRQSPDEHRHGRRR